VTQLIIDHPSNSTTLIHSNTAVSQTGTPANQAASSRPVTNSWFPPSRNVGNVRNGRNLVNVGRWRIGHTLRTLRENMQTKLHQRFLLVNSYGFYVKNRNRFYSYRFHVYVTFCRIRENVYVKIFTYAWFSTLPTLTTYVTWRRKSRDRHTDAATASTALPGTLR